MAAEPCNQGDHKGTPLQWHADAPQARSSIVGAYPCGRPGYKRSVHAPHMS